MAHGVIGNTAVFGTVIQGSSPCGPTKSFEQILFKGFCYLSKIKYREEE